MKNNVITTEETQSVSIHCFNGVIFDLDGTLLDSMEIWANIGEEFLLIEGINPPKDLNNHLRTMSMYQAGEYMVKTFKLPYSVHECMDRIAKLADDKYEFHVQLKPYVLDYLNYLKNQNAKMCIATASEKYHVEAALKRLNVFNYFDFILTCSEIGSGKDDEKIFLDCAKKLGTAPQDIAVFEDSLYAIKTAKGAGFYTIGIYDEWSDGDNEEIKGVCDKYITSFKEMLV